MHDWKEISRVDTGRACLSRALWPYDKYPDAPQLMAGSTVCILDAEGPGVVTCFHVSDFCFLDDVLLTGGPREPDAAARLRIRIYYDGCGTPEIDMPLYAFLGDPTGHAEYFTTVYFAKIKVARNLRLPIPFRRRLRMELTNPTNTDLCGYLDVQWKTLEGLPEGTGYLRVQYRESEFTCPEDVPVISELPGPGTLKAHWLSLGTDLPQAKEGEYVCEGNQEYYVDGETQPSLEYLGTEDAYGHSWGLGGVGSTDFYSALTEASRPRENWTQITMLRCRTEDAIGFTRSLRLLLDYTQEYFARSSRNPLHKEGVFARRVRTSFRIASRSCAYWYAPPETF